MKSFRERNPILIGTVSLIVLLLIFLLAFDLKKLPFVAHNYPVTAEFADAAGLAPGADVRIAGLKVGSVSKVLLGTDRVFVTLSIVGGTTIPRDATAAISLKTILGTKSVVIDARGNGPYLRSGDRIPLDHTEIPFEIYQSANAAVDLLSNVNGKQLNDAFEQLAQITKDPQRNVAGTLKGAAGVLGTLGQHAGSLDTVLSKGDQVLAALDASSPDIQSVLSHTNVIMQVLAKRRTVVESLLRNTDALGGELGGLLRARRPDLDTILTDLHSTLAIVDANLGQLQEALKLIGPSTEAFARLVYHGRWASVCIDAIQVTASPLLPSIDVGTGATPPVDCAAGASSSASASRTSSTLPLWAKLLGTGAQP